jgi:exodeoxyribonuclease VII small subunit
MTSQTDIDALPFETALAELEGIVTRIERGSVTLDESVLLYERGQKLKARCETLLKQAEMRIEVITQGANGEAAGTRPLDVG